MTSTQQPLTAEQIEVGGHYMHQRGRRAYEVVVIEKRDTGGSEPVIHYGRPSRKHPGDFISHSADFASVGNFYPMP